MTILLKRDEGITKVYTGTGEQEEIIFDIKDGYPMKGTLSCIGGSVDDEFVVKEKTNDTWDDVLFSCEGKIPPVPNTGKSKGIKVNIINNVSGNIKLQILL